MKLSDNGGASCGLCGINLQKASLAFAIFDIAHGILGISVVVSMMIKKENDSMSLFSEANSQDKISGYTKFLHEKCPMWLLLSLFGGFSLQVAFGIFLMLGASMRNSWLCVVWLFGALVASPALPITFNFAIIGRLYQWITVCEFVYKIDDHEFNYKINKTVHDGDKKVE